MNDQAQLYRLGYIYFSQYPKNKKHGHLLAQKVLGWYQTAFRAMTLISNVQLEYHQDTGCNHYPWIIHHC